MMTRVCRFAWFLTVLLVVDFVKGQLPYSSQPQPYVIPPGRVIEEYKRQLEDDIYAVERKLDLFTQRECIFGLELFKFCSMELNFVDFILCITNPASTTGSDAFTRGIKFPSSAFTSTPAVLVAIAGIGTVAFGDVKVENSDVTVSGFNIAITGGFPAFPYSLTVQWIACPAKSFMNASVREFFPKLAPPPPPYFPINYAQSPGINNQSPTSFDQIEISNNGDNNTLIYNPSQLRYEEKKQNYEESSQPVDERPSSNRQLSTV
uniref:H-type lectin domain-containing protein n=1 Tax=Arion vulgaris TaxID=1028688 RepID=A0A0B7AA27_9EUPU